MKIAIDVVMCTYNSRRRGLLSLALKSIKDYVPLNRLIVIDRCSDDGTVELVEQLFPDNSLVVRTDANIAHARYLGIKLVETECFAFIDDDDAVILPHWWQTLYNYMMPNVGAVEGSYIQLPDVRGSLHDCLRTGSTSTGSLQRRLSIKELTRRDIIIHGLNPLRSVLSNVIIRREAVVDWRPPRGAGAYEDYLITQHVINKGFRWLVVNEPVALHGAPPKDKFSKLRSSIRKGLWEGAGIKHTGIPVDFIALYSLSRLGGALIKLFKDKDVYNLAMRLAFLLSLPSDRYLSPTR
jgi:glycosyltransferase involved in cell wall biosynthesis